jgi:hypothetical protein
LREMEKKKSRVWGRGKLRETKREERDPEIGEEKNREGEPREDPRVL